MITTANDRIKTGLFLLIAGGVLVVVLLLTSGWRWNKPGARYVIRFSESVTGLEERSLVRFKGVPAGHVEQIQIDPDDPTLVRVTIVLGELAVIREGTWATLGQAGLTGMAYVELDTDEPLGEALAPGSELPSRPSLFSATTEALQDLLKPSNRVAAEKTLEQLQEVLATMQENMDAGMQRYEQLTEKLTGVLDDVDGISASVETLVDQARKSLGTSLDKAAQTAEKLERIATRVDRLMAQNEQTASQTMRDIGASAAKVREIAESERLERMQEHLAGSAKELDELLGRMNDQLDHNEDDVRVTIRHLKQLSSSLAEIGQQLERDPSLIMRGRRAVDKEIPDP